MSDRGVDNTGRSRGGASAPGRPEPMRETGRQSHRSKTGRLVDGVTGERAGFELLDFKAAASPPPRRRR